MHLQAATSESGVAPCRGPPNWTLNVGVGKGTIVSETDEMSVESAVVDGVGGDGDEKVRPTGVERWFMSKVPRGRLGKFAVVVAVIVASAGVLGVGESIGNLECGESPAMLRLQVIGTGELASELLTGGDDPCSESDVTDALWGDFVFIITYVALLGVMAVGFGSTGYRVGKFRRLAVPMAYGTAAAGMLDFGENISLLFAVDREPSELGERSDWPFQIAATFAWAKWFVVALVAFYAVAGVIGYLLMPGWILNLRSGLAEGDERASESAGLPAIGEGAPPVTAAAEQDAAPEPPSRPGDGGAGRRLDRDELSPVAAGIALSGGGVRSATFALGGMQALDTTSDRSWDDATRITSVSGGGYMSGAWSLTRGNSSYQTPAGKISPWADPGAEQRRQGVVSAEETYLRQHLGYLLEAENDRPGGIPTLLVGLLANVFAVLLIVYLFARPFGWLIVEFVDPDVRDANAGGDYRLSISDAQWFPGLAWLVVGVALLLGWVLFSRVQRWIEGGPAKGLARVIHIVLKWGSRLGLLLGLALLFVLVVAPALMVVIPGEVIGWLGDDPGPVVTTLSGIAGIGVAASIWTLIVNQTSKWATKLGGVLLAFAILLLGGWWASDAAVGGVSDTLASWAAWLGFAIVGLYVVSPEWWAMAPFYRGRLRRAYALRNVDGTTCAYSPQDEPLLEDLKRQPGPLAEYCCTLNINDSTVKTLSGIPALSFTMSADAITVHHVDPITGTPSEWSCTPRQLGALMKAEAPDVSPMLAVATSGAAVASAMGRQNKGSTNALLAFANIRLGVWLPHPRWAGQIPNQKAPYPRVRMSYLLKEVFGLFDWDDLHVYVTDGAHWEGTSIVELLRHSDIDEAIAFDAGGAAADSLVSPAEVVTLSSLELFDDVDINVEPLRAKVDGTRGGGLAQRVATVGLVRGVDENGQPTIGILWYARNVLAKDSSARLKSYGERFDTFPSVSTINQFFDDEKFQSYRVLGYEAGEAIVQARRELREEMWIHDDLSAFRKSKNAHWSVVVMKDELLATDAEFRKVRDTLNAPPRGGPGMAAPTSP